MPKSLVLWRGTEHGQNKEHQTNQWNYNIHNNCHSTPPPWAYRSRSAFDSASGFRGAYLIVITLCIVKSFYQTAGWTCSYLCSFCGETGWATRWCSARY